MLGRVSVHYNGKEVITDVVPKEHERFTIGAEGLSVRLKVAFRSVRR